MQISELRQLLSHLENLLMQGQAGKSTQSELARFNLALATCDGLTIAQFEKLLSEAMGKAPPPRTTVRKNDELIATYSQRLVAAGEDRASFEGVISELLADKAARIGELSAIAQAYVGGTSAYKKKTDAIKDIRLRFDGKLATSRRLHAQSEIF